MNIQSSQFPFQTDDFQNEMVKEGLQILNYSDSKITLIVQEELKAPLDLEERGETLSRLHWKVFKFLRHFDFHIRLTEDNKIEILDIKQSFIKELGVWVRGEGGKADIAAQRIKKAFDEKLDVLDLSYLNLNTLPSAIGNLGYLRKLYLNGNQLTSLPETIGNLGNLMEFSLNHNRLTSLPEAIGNLGNLTKLYLDDNQLTSLPEAIGNLGNLTKLYLDDNQLTSLPETIGNLGNLTKLYLDDNQLTNIPETIGNLGNLTELDLNGNQLSGLLEAIGNLSKLTILYLDDNQLTNIPETIGNLGNLTELYLKGNQLSGLPEAIGNLSNLTILNLSGNRLAFLSSQVGRLTLLQELSIDFNRELIDLPLSLGQCFCLTTVNVDFTGIPQETINAILATCRAKRDSVVLQVLPKRLEAWQTASREEPSDLGFIQEMTLQEKQIINEWLTRLERTRDFTTASQVSLAKAVCQMLGSLKTSVPFKEMFFAQVSVNLEACGDRAAMAFNELYMAWRINSLDSSLPLSAKLHIGMAAAKTTALHQALQRRIAIKEREQKKAVSESVEIFLYFETHLKEELGLLTFMHDMLYTRTGQVEWINKEELVQEVNDSYLDVMADFPLVRSLCPEEVTNRSFELENKAQKEMLQLEEQKKEISEIEYLKKVKRITETLDDQKHQIVHQWLVELEVK